MSNEASMTEKEATSFHCEAALNAAHKFAAQLQTQVGRSEGGREISLVITKIDEAMLWLAAFNKSQEA